MVSSSYVTHTSIQSCNWYTMFHSCLAVWLSSENLSHNSLSGYGTNKPVSNVIVGTARCAKFSLLRLKFRFSVYCFPAGEHETTQGIA